MKLFTGGFRDIQSYTVAENEQEAVKQLGEKLCIPHLPIEVKEIDEVDGFFVGLQAENQKQLPIDSLKELLEVQGQDGNWNYDSYMRGLYNGIEVAVAVLEDREPEYREAPEDGYEADKKLKEEEALKLEIPEIPVVKEEVIPDLPPEVPVKPKKGNK